MNKQEFLKRLTSALAGLPQEEVKKTVDYYSEIIDDAVEDGKDESEIISGFDSVEEIAERVINETPIRKFVSEDVKKRNISVGAVVLIIVGSPLWLPILIAIFAVLFSIYIAIWSVIISLFAVFGALALSAVAMIILAPIMVFVRPVKAIFAFGLALLCAGLSVFMFYVSVWSAKLIIRFTVFLARAIKGAFIKKGSEQK
ncbi:MAG: DUF1700 domain-containing protein [Clostridia bacterium]|nr:DUF1700 domain-containing protein [Clostridia bacterium]MCI8979647.1 DUF1700 domain-containing protein [Clostridia bacterium]MCI9085554.1 DUF1700 domain-containing protein [Clostridia bacterium]